MHRLSVPDIETIELMLKDPSGCYHPPKKAREEFCCSGFSASKQGLTLQNKQESMYNMRYRSRCYCRRPVSKVKENPFKNEGSKNKAVGAKTQNELNAPSSKLVNVDKEIATSSNFWWEKQLQEDKKRKEKKVVIKTSNYKDPLSVDNVEKCKRENSNNKQMISSDGMKKKENNKISKLPSINKQSKTDVNTNKTTTKTSFSIKKIPMNLPKIESTTTGCKDVSGLEINPKIYQHVTNHGEHLNSEDFNKTSKAWTINNAINDTEVGETETERIKRMAYVQRSWSYGCLRDSEQKGLAVSGKSSVMAISSTLTITSEVYEKEEKMASTPRSSKHECNRGEKEETYPIKEHIRVPNVTPEPSPPKWNVSHHEHDPFLNDDPTLSMHYVFSSNSEREDLEVKAPSNSPLPHMTTLDLDDYLPSREKEVEQNIHNIDISSLLTYDLIGKKIDDLPKKLADMERESSIQNNHRGDNDVNAFKDRTGTVWKTVNPCTGTPEHCQISNPFVITPKPVYRRHIPDRRYVSTYQQLPIINKTENVQSHRYTKHKPVKKSNKKSSKSSKRTVTPKIGNLENKDTALSDQLDNNFDIDDVSTGGNSTVQKYKHEYEQRLQETSDKNASTLGSNSIPTKPDMETSVSSFLSTEEQIPTHVYNSYQIEIHDELTCDRQDTSDHIEHELDTVSKTSQHEVCDTNPCHCTSTSEASLCSNASVSEKKTNSLQISGHDNTKTPKGILSNDKINTQSNVKTPEGIYKQKIPTHTIGLKSIPNDDIIDALSKITNSQRIHKQNIPIHTINIPDHDHKPKEVTTQSLEISHGRQHYESPLQPFHKEGDFKTSSLQYWSEKSPKFVRRSLKEASLYNDNESETTPTSMPAGDDIENTHSKHFQLDKVYKRIWYRNVGRMSSDEDFARIKRMHLTPRPNRQEDNEGYLFHTKLCDTESFAEKTVSDSGNFYGKWK